MLIFPAKYGADNSLLLPVVFQWYDDKYDTIKNNDKSLSTDSNREQVLHSYDFRSHKKSLKQPIQLFSEVN
ncbi:hypothetical protein SAMN05421841_1908 [Chryseobacterium wanjuense]|jgi:hypothetical protein|uniref:Uncharacterized protein n=1 Tax=Chryseobacterium wanjuense TaxID=356305 RepID=A0A1I0QGZ4_9FLAO|nr:hypothetical protein SAMN05421841_1908 [Chryseobacterium wanjuense]